MFVSGDPRTATIVRCNRTTCDNLGYSEEELIGRSIFDVYALESHDLVRETLDAFRQTGNVRDVEMRVLRKDGSAIDNYVLEERLGEGGMGTVWKARQLRPVKR